MSWPGCNYGDIGYEPTPTDFAATRGMVQAALDAGINLFDTAEGYGRGLAERLLGQTLEEAATPLKWANAPSAWRKKRSIGIIRSIEFISVSDGG